MLFDKKKISFSVTVNVDCQTKASLYNCNFAQSKVFKWTFHVLFILQRQQNKRNSHSYPASCCKCCLIYFWSFFYSYVQEWWRGETSQRPNSLAMSQGLDHTSRMVHWIGSTTDGVVHFLTWVVSRKGRRTS